ncbi:MAG: class I SAM-dependent methyltransferase family protein [Methanocellales archaeon]|nr:class I SAM-dependent methyltransferase family protein [Methanocellales archaeon]
MLQSISNSNVTLSQLLAGVLTEDETELLPSGWQILGDIIVVNIPVQLENRRREVGDALLKLYPRCRTVVAMKSINGRFREPEIEVIAGDTNTETIHKENRCRFKLDASRIMFSQGNLNERRRMSGVGRDELVVDMFAGIGYFSIPMAVHAKPTKIIAIEINPLAYQYLCENIRLNRVESIVRPVHGDCAIKTPAGIADRVIMGSFEAFRHLAHGINALKPGGIIHYHETTPEKLCFVRPISRIIATAEMLDRSIKIRKSHMVKKYSPGVWHIVIDAQVF